MPWYAITVFMLQFVALLFDHASQKGSDQVGGKNVKIDATRKSTVPGRGGESKPIYAAKTMGYL